jgi:hypothetical protein
MLEQVSQNSDEELSVFFVVTKLWSCSAAPPRRRWSEKEIVCLRLSLPPSLLNFE